MKALLLPISLVLFCAPAFAQNADAAQYAARPIALLSNDKTEGVMPMVISVDGTPKIEYVPGSQMIDSLKKGGHLIRFGDLLSLLGQKDQTISALQAENEALKAENAKLWKVATKDSPQPRPPTVVVQQTAPPALTPAEQKAANRQQMIQTWMMMQNANRPQNLNVTVSNCTRYPALCAGR